MLLDGLLCIKPPQVGHARRAGEPGVGFAEEAAGTCTLLALADTAPSGSLDPGCSIGFRPKGDVALRWLSCETHPAIEYGRPSFTTGTGLDTHGRRGSLYDVAKTYFLFDEEPWETYAMRLALAFIC